MKTKQGMDISKQMVSRRLSGLVNQFYKILPIKESGESTLQAYMSSLQREMLGCQSLILALGDDPQYLTLLSILQYMIDYECDVATVRSEVFKSISILKRMRDRYDAMEG